MFYWTTDTAVPLVLEAVGGTVSRHYSGCYVMYFTEQALLERSMKRLSLEVLKMLAKYT